MQYGNLPYGLASESRARSRPVHRAREPFTRAIRRVARWGRRNRHQSVPEPQAAPSPELQERHACYGHSGSALNLLSALYAVLILGVFVVATSQAEEIEYDNGDRYVGDVSNDGEPHGYGIYRWRNGRTYSGEWFFGKSHGRGKTIYPDGIRFEGEYLLGKPNGDGVKTWPNGIRLEADYIDGVPVGTVKLHFPNGALYEGEWREGPLNGYGVYTLVDGRRFEGKWRDNVLQFGEATSPEGWHYKGQFNDKLQFHGQGVFTTADGSRLIGQWRGDKVHGHANVTLPDGRREDREYVDGKLVSATQATEPNLSSSAPPSPQQLQSALAALGFDPGPVDGKIGPKTRDAIAKWQESVGERPTGTLDPAQRTALVESAEGEHGAPEQGVANQTGEGDSTATPAARSHAPAGGCAAQIAQFEEQADAVGEAMDEYNRRTSDELGLGGLGGCGPLVIGYHANRNYANLLNRCSEVDPTGELRAEVKKSTDAMAEGADRICAVDDWPRSLLSMEELIQRLRSLTPLDQWKRR